MTGIAVLVIGVLTTGVLASCGPKPFRNPRRPRRQARSTFSPTRRSSGEFALRRAGQPTRTGRSVRRQRRPGDVTYELGVHNPTPFALTLTTAEVLDPSGHVLQKLEQRAVAANLPLPSERSGVKQPTEGQVATLYVTLQFAGRSDVPARLDNRITVAGLPGGTGYTSELTAVPISGLEPPVLGPPLEAGTRYIAADSCCDSVRPMRSRPPAGSPLSRTSTRWKHH